MKVLLIDTGDLEIVPINRELSNLGHDCNLIKKEYYPLDPFQDKWKQNDYDNLQLEEYDIVFTTTFLPGLARRCAETNTYYFSWVLHMPCVALYSQEVVLPTNRIFCLDMDLVQLFRQGGIETIFYLPYAVDVVEGNGERDGIAIITELDIADRHNVYRILNGMKDATKGYLDGAAAAQAAIYPDLILQKLPGYIMEDILNNMVTLDLPGNMASREWIAKEYLYADMLTARERIFLCSEISGYEHVTYYMNTKVSTEGVKQEQSPKSIQNGEAEAYSKAIMGISMPKRSYHNCIFKETLKIMAGGAMALSPYSLELAEFFTQEQNIVMFTTDKKFKDLLEYYDQHSDEALEIGRKGQEYVKQTFNYQSRMIDMLSTI